MDKIEAKILKIIDEHRQQIIDFAEDIYQYPELGYKETRTAGKIFELLQEITAKAEKNLAITGVKAYLKEPQQNEINLALIGELDAVSSPHHAYADKTTGACHACGHHCQLAGMIGAALALADEEIKNSLTGNVTFFAVPSEEYGEVEFKLNLKEKKLIKHGGGKSELLRIGAFNDIDIAITHHSRPGSDDVVVGDRLSNGFVSKVIRYKGRAAHAAANPHLGVNALNAAALGLNALAMQRETFQDKDMVRIHTILTKGGSLVNVIPEEVVIESLVRANNVKAIEDASKKTDRAFEAGALALGANLEIYTSPGYLPIIPRTPSRDILDVANMILPQGTIRTTRSDESSAGSSDVGDLTHVMPVLTFETGGVSGDLHSKDFKITNKDIAYIATAKIMALTAYRLLKENAEKAKNIKKDFKPSFSIEEYKKHMDQFESILKKNFSNQQNF